MMRCRAIVLPEVYFGMNVFAGISLLIVLYEIHRTSNAHHLRIRSDSEVEKTGNENKCCGFTHISSPPAKGSVTLPPHNVTESNKNLSFAVADYFTFPLPALYRSISVVLKSSWMKPLQNFLRIVHASSSKQVILVGSNSDRLPEVLNWLVSATVLAHVPLKDILLVSFDHPMYELLTKKDIMCIEVSTDSILTRRKYGGRIRWFLTRLGLVRLLNHWGFDVLHLDADAVILKNPYPLLDAHPAADLIATNTSEAWPFQVGHLWGVTFCGGAFLLRSTPKTELFWKQMPAVKNTFDDQVLMNTVLLEHLNLKWLTEVHNLTKVVRGRGDSGFVAFLLPHSNVCRKVWCRSSHIKSSDVYVWHEGGGAHCTETPRIWFLRDDWSTTKTNTVAGQEWLQQLLYDDFPPSKCQTTMTGVGIGPNAWKRR